jgi:hypothetical protein
MKMAVFFLVVGTAISSGPLGAQESKPVPKDSVRVFIPGCSKGLIFTAGPRTEERSGGSGVPEGMHLRMSGPKAMMAEIKAQAGSMIEITGLIKRGQFGEPGVRVGRGVRITPGPSSSGGSLTPNPGVSQIMIDVEGWRHILGDCPSR